MYALAHLSDLHVTRPRPAGPGELCNKRLLGFLSWLQRRRHVHRPQVLEALLEDLAAHPPDHVAVTGDLTQVGLPSEIEEARSWLARIGPPERVTLIPGNHDAYARSAPERSWETRWPAYIAGDADPGARELRGPDAFPILRRRGPLALIGMSSALPSPPLMATGVAGLGQLIRLERMLRELGREGLCRVVLIHHRPTAGEVWRRRLRDAALLRDVLAGAGAELVLHGHSHRSVFTEVPGPARPIPVVGVPSASDGTGRPEKGARYHVYRIEERSAGDFRIGLCARGWDPASGRVSQVEERELA